MVAKNTKKKQEKRTSKENIGLFKYIIENFYNHLNKNQHL